MQSQNRGRPSGLLILRDASLCKMLLLYLDVSALGETAFEFVLAADIDQVERNSETGRVRGPLSVPFRAVTVRAAQPKPNLAAMPAENVGRSHSRRTLR